MQRDRTERANDCRRTPDYREQGGGRKVIAGQTVEIGQTAGRPRNPTSGGAGGRGVARETAADAVPLPVPPAGERTPSAVASDEAVGRAERGSRSTRRAFRPHVPGEPRPGRSCLASHGIR